jgi:hypothetical protein
MASQLHNVGLSVAPAIGVATESEFNAFITLYKTLPDLTPILEGDGKRIAFPTEPSVRYATTIGLTVRAANANQGYNAFTWLSEKATAEWVQLYATDLTG